MNNLTIKIKLIASFTILVLLVMGISGASYYSSKKVSALKDEAMWNADFVKLLKEREIDHLIWTEKLSESIIVNEKFDGQLDPTKCQFGQWYQEFINSEDFNNLPESMQQNLLAMDEPHNDLHNSANQIESVKKTTNQKNVIYLFENSAKKNLEELRTLINQVDNEAEKIELDLEKKSDFAETTFLYVIIAVSVLAILITIILASILTKGIVKPINNTVEMLKDISDGEGDLTRRLHVKSNDEIGALARSFNVFIEKIQGIVVDVNKGAVAVSASSEELSVISEQSTQVTTKITSALQEVASGAEMQLEGSKEVLSAMEEMTKGIQHTAETSSDVSEESFKTAKEAEQGNELIKKAVVQMNFINNSVNDSSSVIKLLEGRSQAIGQIIKVITDIADQTNLLALNAAIEAARAGEHGKGFAVVADEVRKLAEQSKESSEQIVNLIREIQGDTNKSVEAMDKVTKEVTIGMDVVKQAGVTFGQIVEASQGVADKVQEVSAISEEMSASSQEISASIQEMARIAKDSSSSAQEVASSSQEQSASMEEMSASADSLDKMSHELKKLVGKFKIN